MIEVKLESSEDVEKIYKVGYCYDFYDDYGNGDPKSTTFRSSVLTIARSEEEAIEDVDRCDAICDRHYPYIDGYPYDFEIVGVWNSMDEYNKENPGSNIPIIEYDGSGTPILSNKTESVEVYENTGKKTEGGYAGHVTSCKYCGSDEVSINYKNKYKDGEPIDHYPVYQCNMCGKQWKVPEKDRSKYERYMPIGEALEDDPEDAEQ